MTRYLTDEAHAAMLTICNAPTLDLPGQAPAAPCHLADAYLASGTDAGRFLIAAAFVAEGWAASGIEASDRFWREIETVADCVKGA